MQTEKQHIESLRQQVARLQEQLASLQQATEPAPTQSPSDVETLRRANELHKAIIENAAEGICACYVIEEFPHVRFSHWNRRMVEITGYTMDEINRLGWYQTMYPDPESSQQAAQRMARMRDGDHLDAEEWEITRKDAGLRTVAISTTDIATEDGIPAVAAMMQDVTERKRAQQALADSRRENDLLVQAIPDMLLRVDRQGNYLSYKPPTGFRPWRSDDKVVGKNIRDSVPPVVAGRALELIQRAIDRQQPQHMDIALPTVSGDVYRDVRIVPAESGQALIIIRDVSKEKNATVALSHSQRQNRVLLSSIPDLLMRLRKDGTFLWARSPDDFPLLMSLDEAIGKRADEILPPELASQAMRLVRLALETQSIQTFQYVLPLASETAHFEARLVPTSEDEVLAMVRDVTQRRRAEIERDEFVRLTESIRRVQSRYISKHSARELHDEMLSEFIGLTDSEYGFIGEVLHDDDGTPYLRTLAITNIAWDDATRKYYDEMSERGLEFRNLNTLFGQALVTQQVVIANEPATDPRRGGLPPGHPALEAFLGVPLLHDGTLVGMVGVANRNSGYDHDIVEYAQPLLSTFASLMTSLRHQAQRQEAEQRLSQQERQLAHNTRLKTLGEMVAAMAHEMTQPLAAISNYAAAASTQAASLPSDAAPSLGPWLDKIAQQATRGGKIIERLRTFTKRGEPVLEPIALEETIADAIELIELHMKRHDVQVEFATHGAPLEFVADRTQIQQVVINLLSNATEATAEVAGNRKTVRVALTFGDNNAIISVSDNGCGIPPAKTESIFEPFVTTKTDGIGMGLAICRSIVEAHGGRIWHTSNPIRGTTFHVQLNTVPQRNT